jgi:hypothetical protein
MTRFTTIVQQLVRLLFVVQLVLGLCFWAGKITGLIPVHISLGMIFVLLLWILGVVGFMARIGAGLPLLLIVTGVVVAAVGMVQRSIMVGDQHWVIRVLHLVLVMITMPMAERLAARIKARPASLST